jgi:hypothetical protein
MPLFLIYCFLVLDTDMRRYITLYIMVAWLMWTGSGWKLDYSGFAVGFVV